MSQLTPTEYLDNSDLLFNVAKSGPGELYILPQRSRAVTIQIGRGDDAFAQEVSESVDFGIEIGRFLGYCHKPPSICRSKRDRGLYSRMSYNFRGATGGKNDVSYESERSRIKRAGENEFQVGFEESTIVMTQIVPHLFLGLISIYFPRPTTICI